LRLRGFVSASQKDDDFAVAFRVVNAIAGTDVNLAF